MVLRPYFRKMFVRGREDDNLALFTFGHIALLLVSIMFSQLVVTLLQTYTHVTALNFLYEFATVEFMGFLALLIWVHEMSHLALMKQNGAVVFGLLLPPVGGFMVMDRELDAQAKVPSFLAGPASGLVAAPLLVTGLLVDSPRIVLMACIWAGINWLNLLPLIPLDGGWIAKVILQTWMSNKTAKNVMSAFTVVFLVLITWQIPDKRALIIPVVLTTMLALMDKFVEKTFTKFSIASGTTTPRVAKKLTPREVPQALLAYFLLFAMLTGLMAASVLGFMSFG